MVENQFKHTFIFSSGIWNITGSNTSKRLTILEEISLINNNKIEIEEIDFFKYDIYF